MKTHSTSRSSVYDIITDRVVSLLEQGTIPWHKPWKVQTGWPRNLVSKKPYRGINVFLLHAMHFESPYWLTFKQAQELGGHIRKGEKACPVVFWKTHETEDKHTGEKVKIPLLRFYHVFNVAQCDGLKNIPAVTEEPQNRITSAAQIIEQMPQRPAIKHGMAKAFYSPAEDFIGLPSPERFENEEKYYSVTYHEAVHNAAPRIMPRRSPGVL